MFPICGWIQAGDEQERAHCGGNNFHVVFGGVFIGIVGWTAVLGDPFFGTYLVEFAMNKLLGIVVNDLLRYVIALDVCEQGWSRLASALSGIGKNQASIIIKVESEHIILALEISFVYYAPVK